MNAPAVRNWSRLKTGHRPQTGSEKFRSRSGPDGSWRKDPFVQHAKNPRRRAPDVALAIGHRVVETLHAAEFLAVKLVVHRVHQESQGHLEGIVDFGRVDAQLEAGLDLCHRRQDAKAEACSI